MKKTELSRLKTVIESDRLSMTGENTALIVKDITAVLEDYFALSGEPELKIEAKNCEYRLTISVSATAIKSFSTLQKG